MREAVVRFLGFSLILKTAVPKNRGINRNPKPFISSIIVVDVDPVGLRVLGHDSALSPLTLHPGNVPLRVRPLAALQGGNTIKKNFGLSFGLKKHLSFGLRFPTPIKSLTRGQWPFRLASSRAMKNGQVMLYDLNYLDANIIF